MTPGAVSVTGVIARVSVAVMVVGVLVVGSSSASAGWKHVSVVRRVGAIEATLSYDARPEPGLGGPANTSFRRISLVVRRAGKITAEHRIRDGVWLQLNLTLRNVWGSRDPEALVHIASCGNRCGVQLYVALSEDGGRSHFLLHDFGAFWSGPDAAWYGQWRRGRFYFLSYDQRFFCTFTACAGSFVPPQVFAIDTSGRGFVDVTRSRPDVVAANARYAWRQYLSGRGKTPTDWLAVGGVIAPWCADQYLLGRRAHCDQALAQALAHRYLGDIPGSAWPTGRALITYLHKELSAWGYAQS